MSHGIDGRFSREIEDLMLLAAKSLAGKSWTRRTFCLAVGLLSNTTTPHALENSLGNHCTNPRLGRHFSTMSSEAVDPAPTLKVAQFPCLNDNYGYLIHDEKTGQTAAIDTPDAAAYRNELERQGWQLTHIFNTHHHWDHTGGNAELKSDAVRVYGPAKEKAKIPGIDELLQGGDEFEFGSFRVKILEVGGHTLGHIAYYFPSESKAFVGDSLFALGCGRMFEGTPTQFWDSLQLLRGLPDETLVYCAHEYTASNAKFAASVEPGNADLIARVAEVNAARDRQEPTVPSLLGVEKKTNPFLRCDFSEEIRQHVGVVDGDSDAEAFAKVRRAKDNFRG